MSIQGNLNTMELSDLLQWLSSGQKNGTLVVRSEEGITKRVFFNAGKILSAAANDPKEYLGHFLIAHGYINEEQLNMAMQTQMETGIKLGRILVECGMVDESDLQAMLRLKVRETIYSLFLWPEGAFEFVDGDAPDVAKLVPIQMDVMSIIMEGVRRRDEYRRIKKVFSNSRHVLGKTKKRLKLDSLHPQSLLKKSYELIDGTRSLEDLALELHAQEFEILSTLYKLYNKGLLEIVGEKEDPAARSLEMIQGQLLPQIHEAMSKSQFDQARNLIKFLLIKDPNNIEGKALLTQIEEREEAEVMQAFDRGGVPVLLKSWEDLENAALSPQEGFLLTRINGSWSFDEIMKITPIPEKEALRSFKKLLDNKVIGLSE